MQQQDNTLRFFLILVLTYSHPKAPERLRVRKTATKRQKFNKLSFEQTKKKMI